MATASNAGAVEHLLCSMHDSSALAGTTAASVDKTREGNKTTHTYLRQSRILHIGIEVGRISGLSSYNSETRLGTRQLDGTGTSQTPDHRSSMSCSTQRSAKGVIITSSSRPRPDSLAIVSQLRGSRAWREVAHIHSAACRILAPVAATPALQPVCTGTSTCRSAGWVWLKGAIAAITFSVSLLRPQLVSPQYVE